MYLREHVARELLQRTELMATSLHTPNLIHARTFDVRVCVRFVVCRVCVELSCVVHTHNSIHILTCVR